MAVEASPLNTYRNADLTLDALVVAAFNLLITLDLRQDDGRITEAPDARGIRYYQTIGVLDPPLRYDGRRAIYGFRHLLQLLAVKRLQQEGHPLQLIQQTLAGRSTAALEQALGAVLNGPEPERGQAPSRSLAPHDEPTPAPAPLIAVRLAPGVTMTIDPQVVADPDALITRAAAILTPEKSAPGRITPDPDAHTNKEH